MKIALLGASNAGKTVYFSGLAYRFRNAIALRPLTEAQRREYQQMGVSRRLGIRISIPSAQLERTLSENLALLSRRPIDEWPEPTAFLDTSTIDCFFDFRDLDESGSRTSFRRTIELYDPPGGVFRGIHDDSDEIVDELTACDVCIAFLPADTIIECVRREDPDLLQNNLLLGKIIDIVHDVRRKLGKKDVLPLCFVVSKADLLTDDVIETFNRMLYDELLIPFSLEHKNILICICPISVLDPVSGSFRASNLEWPFLFAAGGTIFRNSLELRKEAKSARSAAQAAERMAGEIAGGGWWNRFRHFIRGEGVGVQRRRAQSYRNECGRLITEAEDDHELARNVWGSIAVEGKWRHVRVFMEGVEIDPRDGLSQ